MSSAQFVYFAKAIRSCPEVQRSTLYRALCSEAQRYRKDGMSAQQALVRLVNDDAIAKAVFSVHAELQRRGITAFAPDTPAGLEILKGLRRTMDQSGDESGARGYGRGDDGSRYPSGRAAPNTPELEQDEAEEEEDGDEATVAGLVRTTMAKHPGMSRPKATVLVLDTPIGKRAYQPEREVRLRKCLGGG
jgi:hypothetical protein